MNYSRGGWSSAMLATRTKEKIFERLFLMWNHLYNSFMSDFFKAVFTINLSGRILDPHTVSAIIRQSVTIKDIKNFVSVPIEAFLFPLLVALLLVLPVSGGGMESSLKTNTVSSPETHKNYSEQNVEVRGNDELDKLIVKHVAFSFILLICFSVFLLGVKCGYHRGLLYHKKEYLSINEKND